MKELFKIKDEKPFSVDSLIFVIGESETGYTLEMSVNTVNGENGTDWAECSDPIPANKIHQVVYNARGSWYRLKGNTGEVVIRW